MNHLTKAINLLASPSEFREFIREELPDPKPPRKWFTNQMAKLRRANPETSPLERSKKVKDTWYSLPSHEQKKLSREPAIQEKRKMSLKIKAQDLEDTTEEMDEEEQYQAKVEAIEAKYEPKMKRILGEMVQVFEHAGYATSGVFDMSDEHLRLNFIVYEEGEETGDPQENDVDVSFQVAPSVHFDGSLEGVSFIIDVVSVGGRIIGGMSPYNYTDEVWVDVNDEAAIEERFSIFEQANPEEVVDLAEDFWKGK